MLLRNKVGLVTGGGDGIGRGTCQALAEQGARVVVSDVNAESGSETAELIRQAGGEAHFVQADVSSEEQVESLVAQTVERFGALHLASNNAAIGGGYDALTEIEEATWEQVQNINLKGPWLCMKYEIPAMLASGGGAIVNISSMAGYKGMALQAAYSASKGGVIALTKTAASEYAQQGIRVNAICPGGVRTAGLQSFLDTMPGLDETVARVHAMGRLGEVREIADAVVFLCSDRSSFMTGHIMPIEGGALVKSL